MLKKEELALLKEVSSLCGQRAAELFHEGDYQTCRFVDELIQSMRSIDKLLLSSETSATA